MDHHTLSTPMAREAVATITVNYRNVEGYHTFTSDDVRGLYVASKDARKAFDDVSIVLKELIDLKAGVSCAIEPTISFDEWLESDTAAKHVRPINPPLALGSRRYLVREAA